MPTDEPSNPVESPAPSARRRSVVQLLGFTLGLCILGWVIWSVTRDQNRLQEIKRLASAPLWQYALALGLSGLTVALSGLVFSAMSLGIDAKHRPGALRCVGVNSVCSLLSYLPMKISLIFRLFFHRRMDGMDWLTIAAWMASVAAIILISLTPPFLATWLVKELDLRWWSIAVGGILFAGFAVPVVASFFSGQIGLSRIESILRTLIIGRVGFVARIIRAQWFAKLHAGLIPLSSKRAVWLGLTLRCADVAAQAARFYLVSRMVGAPLSAEQCVLAGAVYFFIQAASPAGVAGPREGGLIAILGQDAAAVVLAVSAAEAVANLLMGGLSAAMLRVDRLLTGERKAEDNSAENDSNRERA